VNLEEYKEKKMTPWIISAIFAVACGAFFLAYLVASPLQMSWFLVLLAAGFILWGLLAWRFFRGWEIAADVGDKIINSTAKDSAAAEAELNAPISCLASFFSSPV